MLYTTQAHTSKRLFVPPSHRWPTSHTITEKPPPKWEAVQISCGGGACLAFGLGETRRWATFLLIIPFFTSYLVRTFSWFVILSESGVINGLLGTIGLGPYGPRR